MNVLIFGATGATGQQLVKQSLISGHDTSAFVHRGPLKATGSDNKVTVYRGDVLDFSAVDAAIQGQDAVLVALGVIPGRTRHILSEGTANIVRSMENNHVKRLVVETGAGLIEDQNQLPLLWRVVSVLPPMRGMFADKRKQEKYIRGSDLDWVIVRPATLTNGPLTESYRVGETLPLRLTSTISRADVADFMVSQVDSSEWLGKAAMLEN